jgi:hypothetical protein
MIEYKYQKVKGFSEKKFLEDGHTMFEEDVLQRLKRLAHLEEQMKEKPMTFTKEDMDKQRELLLAFGKWYNSNEIIKPTSHILTDDIDVFLHESNNQNKEG